MLENLISTETLQDDFQQIPSNVQELVSTKSTLRNIVTTAHDCLSNYFEEPQFNILKEPNQQDSNKTINEKEINNENKDRKDQETLMEIEQSPNSQDLMIKTKRKMPSKEKNNNKIKLKSCCIITKILNFDF